MTVLKPTTSQGRKAARAALCLLLLLACAGGPTLAAAARPARRQQTPPAQGSRPRRVTPPATSDEPRRPADTNGTTRQSPPRASEEVDENDVVRVETQLINVPAVVTDRTGRPLANLRADNFALYEDGQLQRIASFATTEAPFEVALLLDTSGSTRAEVGLIRRAALAFVDSLRPGDRVALLAFSTAQEGQEKLAVVEVKAPLTSDREALREAVESIGSSNGTPFYDGLERVAAEVFREPAREEVRGRRALVALTDGVDSSSAADFEEARQALRRAGVVCYFVQVNTEDFVESRLLQDCEDDGALRLSRAQMQRYRRLFAPGLDPSDFGSFCRLGQFERMDISRKLYRLARAEMNDLARDSGGRTFPVLDLQEARAAFRQVAQEIGTQYSLGYYPTNKSRDGRFRTIRVQVRGVKDAQVRARSGYVPGS